MEPATPPSPDTTSESYVQTTHQNPKLAKLTLEMFMNNSYYKKYLSTSDPSAYKEHQGFLDALVHYRSSILELTKQLLDSPETQITAPVLESFRQYASTCIKYIELRELEDRAENGSGGGGEDREWSDGESDHEMLFGDQSGESLSMECDLTPFPKSFWGPAVQKQRPPIRGGEDDVLAENFGSSNSSSGKSFWGDIRAFSNKKH